jgi:proteasome accessory factor B
VTAKVERLVNLTIALLETRTPLSLAEIKRRTGYYRQDDTASARRMFERDKDDLRRLGVPIETRPVPFGPDDGYLVDRSAYELPDVDLTAEEVAALALAVRLTGDDAGLALAKLAARAPDPADLGRVPATHVDVAPGSVDAVADAVLARSPIRFRYRPAQGAPAERTVDPYAVVHRRGWWYLVGRDHARDALRVFRLDRIEDRPTIVGPPRGYVPPDDLDLAAVVAGPDSGEVDVELAVAPTARWAVEARGGVDTGVRRGDAAVLRVPGLDPVRDLPWLLAQGAEVEVLAPAEVRAAVIRALRRLVGGPSDRDAVAPTEVDDPPAAGR